MKLKCAATSYTHVAYRTRETNSEKYIHNFKHVEYKLIMNVDNIEVIVMQMNKIHRHVQSLHLLNSFKMFIEVCYVYAFILVQTTFGFICWVF